MPGMDGITAIGHIRARPDDKANVPIIVITADTALDLRERCLAAGANEVLFKPVAMDALFEAMGRILAQDPGGATIGYAAPLSLAADDRVGRIGLSSATVGSGVPTRAIVSSCSFTAKPTSSRLSLRWMRVR